LVYRVRYPERIGIRGHGKQGFRLAVVCNFEFSIALEPNWTFMIRPGKMIGLPQLLFIEPMTT
jgi:hypothetical protein